MKPPASPSIVADEVVAAQEGDMEAVRLDAGSLLEHDGLLFDAGAARSDMCHPSSSIAAASLVALMANDLTVSECWDLAILICHFCRSTGQKSP